MSSEERTSATARIWIDDEGIVHYVSLGNKSTAESVSEGLGIVREITGRKRCPILFDGREWPKGDPASWSRFIAGIEAVCTAAAVVTTPATVQAMGAFPRLLDDLVIPFRLFDAEEPALAFLRRHAAG